MDTNYRELKPSEKIKKGDMATASKLKIKDDDMIIGNKYERELHGEIVRKKTGVNGKVYTTAKTIEYLNGRSPSTVINHAIERLAVLVGYRTTIPAPKCALTAYEKLPKKQDGKPNPDAEKVLTQFAGDLGISIVEAFILIEQIERGE